VDISTIKINGIVLMTEQTPPTLTDAQIAEREELFRHTDMSHPLIEYLFNIPPANSTDESQS
jgi:hypothetical protein